MVDAAGGLDVLGHAGEPSHRVTIDQVRASAPDILILMPCGFSLARTVSEVTVLCRKDSDFSRVFASASKTYVVDAGSYFSRPGPRLVDGVELMAESCAGTVAAGHGGNAIRDLTGNLCLTGHSI
jgi:iron complex transport system substrate-binding protein